MGGKSSRRKGAAAEREWCHYLSDHGFPDATRNRIGVDGDDILHPLMHQISYEVKRQEKLSIPAWLRQAEEQAAPNRTPVLAFRQNSQPWRVVIPADHYLQLLKEQPDAE